MVDNISEGKEKQSFVPDNTAYAAFHSEVYGTPEHQSSSGTYKATDESRSDPTKLDLNSEMLSGAKITNDAGLALFIEEEVTRYDRSTHTYFNGDKPVYQHTDTGFKRWDSDGELQARGSYNPTTKTYTTEFTDVTTQYKVVETPRGARVFEKGPASDDWSEVSNASEKREALENARKLRNPPKLEGAA